MRYNDGVDSPARRGGRLGDSTWEHTMSEAAAKLSLLERREIEARIVGPLVEAMRAELGTEKTLVLLRRVIADLARQGGAELARSLGEASLPAFARCLDRWSEGGALEIEVLEQSDERLSFNVTRCRYAEMYRRLGLESLGSSLSCQRDFALVEGFNPAITLERTATIMEGAPFCDFRFRAPAAAATSQPDAPPERPPRTGPSGAGG
jgi:hypothetical protein